MVLAWEKLRRFLWCWSSFCCCYSSFIFICRCFSFCCCIFISFPGYFTMSPALHPGFSGPWKPPPALSSTPTTFGCLFFLIYRERYGFERAFFTHRCFLPYAPSRHFWHIPTFSRNLLLSRLPWDPALTPWNLQDFILVLETQTQPIYLFDSQ